MQKNYPQFGANDGEFIKRINHNLKQELANNHASVE